MSLVRVVLSAALLAGCGSGGGFPDALPIDAPPTPGTFSLQWAVKDALNNTITCNEIGAQTVTVLTHNRAVMGGSTEVFTCATLSGTSQGLVAGTYDMDFELGGTGGAVGTGLLATAPKQSLVAIAVGENTPLMPLTFAVDATGGIKIKLSANKPGHNCGTVANQGAGITGMTLTLQHSGSGACQPVMFSYPASQVGPQLAGTYLVNCTTPTPALCIEDDQELSVAGVPSDTYQLHVRAKVGTPECYTNDDTMPVPALGRDVVRTLNFAAVSPTPSGC